MTTTGPAVAAQPTKPQQWPKTLQELKDWVRVQPATNARVVVQAYLRLFWNDPIADILHYLSDWMESRNIKRSQLEPIFNELKLELAEHNRLNDQRRNDKLVVQRAVLKDRLISSGYCTSKSHAYNLARQDNTNDQALAKMMAEVFGGLWVNYYRRSQQRGPRRKIVAGVMRLRPDAASFNNFSESELPEQIAATVEVMARRDEDHFGDRYADESEFLDVADKRGVDTDEARLAWSYYTEWAIEITAGYARLLIRFGRAELEAKAADLDFG
jgi:hypothetical protein